LTISDELLAILGSNSSIAAALFVQIHHRPFFQHLTIAPDNRSTVTAIDGLGARGACVRQLVNVAKPVQSINYRNELFWFGSPNPNTKQVLYRVRLKVSEQVSESAIFISLKASFTSLTYFLFHFSVKLIYGILYCSL
jgi:hypothetical protein